MLADFVQRLRGGSRPKTLPRTPPGVRLYAVGDIHGRADLLLNLLEQIRLDPAEADIRKIVIFLGDYVDRGLQSRQVIDILLDISKSGHGAVFLKGNHEQAMCQFLADSHFGRTWKYYGGLETLHSYGITELALSDDPRDFERARQHLQTAMPEAHVSFLHGLALSAEFGDYFFAHAGIRPGIGLHRQIEEDLLWIREEFLQSTLDHGKVVVHGHTPEEQASFRRNRIGIDTGAYMTGVLTALVLDGTEQRLLQTEQTAGRAAATG